MNNNSFFLYENCEFAREWLEYIFFNNINNTSFFGYENYEITCEWQNHSFVSHKYASQALF